MAWLTLENRHTGEILNMRRIRDEEGAMTLEIRGSLPAGGDGPPLHVHHQEAERGTVTGGTLGAVVDGREITVGVGETSEFPMGSWHRWWNAGSDTLEVVGEAGPVVDLDRYLQAAS